MENRNALIAKLGLGGALTGALLLGFFHQSNPFANLMGSLGISFNKVTKDNVTTDTMMTPSSSSPSPLSLLKPTPTPSASVTDTTVTNLPPSEEPSATAMPTPLAGLTSTPMPAASPTPSVSPTQTQLPTPPPSPTDTPISPTPTPPTNLSPLAVVINEIAWMGTKANDADEWMELYNTTPNPIDLSGWTLRSETDGSPNIALKKTIEAFGYYLIERSDDKTTDITADLTVSFGTGGLKNTGEKLVLKDSSGNIQDTVDGSSHWYAGIASPGYKSMERINPKESGDNASNWATNNGIIKNGHDAGGNEINGTPRAANSVSP